MKKMHNVIFGIIIILAISGIFINTYRHHEKNSSRIREISITGFTLNPSDSSKVERTFVSTTPNSGEIINISLNIKIDPSFSHSVYLIEEHVPQGITIIDKGTAHQYGQILKWSQIVGNGNIPSNTLTYKIRIPYKNKKFTFVGYYGVDGMDKNAKILGDDVLTVHSFCVPNFLNTTWSVWTNISCASNNLMNQTSNLLQYDSARCTNISKIIFRHRHLLFCNYLKWKPHIYFKSNYFDKNYTTNFSSLNKSLMQNLHELKFRIINSKTTLRFLDKINISRNINLTNNVLLSNKWVYINSNNLPDLNHSASIVFYNINYSKPDIFRDGKLCSPTYCKNISYKRGVGIYSFSVNSFSNYSIHQENSCNPNITGNCNSHPQYSSDYSTGGNGEISDTNNSHTTNKKIGVVENSSPKIELRNATTSPEEKQKSATHSIKIIFLIMYILLALIVIAILILIFKYKFFRKIREFPYSKLRDSQLVKK